MIRKLLTDARETSYWIRSSLLTAECSTVELPGIRTGRNRSSVSEGSLAKRTRDCQRTRRFASQLPPSIVLTYSHSRCLLAPREVLSDDIQSAHGRHPSGCNFDIYLKSSAPGAGSFSQAHRHGRVPVAAPHRPTDLPRRKENRLRAPLRRSNDRQALLESLDNQYGWNRPSPDHHPDGGHCRDQRPEAAGPSEHEQRRRKRQDLDECERRRDESCQGDVGDADRDGDRHEHEHRGD